MEQNTADCRNPGVQNQRIEKQKTASENQSKGIESLLRQPKDTGETAVAGIRRNMPDGVQRVAQLNDHGGSSKP